MMSQHLFKRFYSSPRSIQMRGRPIAFNIVDPWLPPPLFSSLAAEKDRLIRKIKSFYVYDATTTYSRL